MEEDTIMQNGHQPSYPDPSTNNLTPYPSISQNGYEFPSTQPPLSNGYYPSTTTVSTSPSVLSASSTYTTLAEYFKLGSVRGQALRQRNDADGTELEPEPQQRPWTSEFFKSYSGTGPTETSLPGYHYLPENDRLIGTALNTKRRQDKRPAVVGSQTESTQRRGPGRPKGSGRVSKPDEKKPRHNWKKALKGTEHADIFKTPRLPRDPTAKPKGRKVGQTTKPVDPGDEFKRLQKLASEAYLEGNYEEALGYAFKAITANPEVFAPHSLVASIREAQGFKRDVVSALTNGAAVKRDPVIWIGLAERYVAFGGNDFYPDNIERAISCYVEAIKLDTHNYEARVGKLNLLLKLGDNDKARRESKMIARIRPDDLNNIRQCASLCDISAFERKIAIQAYDSAFNYYADQDSFGEPKEQWDHLNVYLDLLNRLDSPAGADAVHKLKRLARWFLGRKSDTFWDNITLDDREYDSTHKRREKLWQFQQGRVTLDNRQYGDGLPLDIRVKLGLFRLQISSFHHNEAFKHFDYLTDFGKSNKIEEYADMFLEVAESLRSHGAFNKAISFYEPLRTFSELVDDTLWVDLAQCYGELGRSRDAEECYLAAIEAAEDNMDARLALVKLYESTKQTVEAFEMASEISKMGRSDLLRREKIRLLNRKGGKPRKKTSGNKGDQAKRRTSNKKQQQPAAMASGGKATIGKSHAYVPIRSRPLLEGHGVENGRIATTNMNGWKGGENDDEIASNSEESDDIDEDAHEGAVAETQVTRSKTAVQSLSKQKARLQVEHLKVQELWPSVETGKDESATQQWMEHATAMANVFRSTKEFFPSQTRDKFFTGLRTGMNVEGRKFISDMEQTKKRLHKAATDGNTAEALRSIDEGTPGDFHGIPFSEWHCILSNLALVYAKRVEQDKCYDILQMVVMRANVFRHNLELMNTTLSVCICCALMFNDTKFLSETVQQYEFPRPYRSTAAAGLIAASGRLGYGDVHFCHRNTQYWAQSMVKERDYLAMSPEMRRDSDWGKDAGRLSELAERFDNISVKDDLDPGLLTTYAHIHAHRQGNSNLALTYLFRALALQPENVVVNLSIATTYITNFTQKSVQNKQYAIAQGQAFMYRYYDLRVASRKACHLQEAEYNVARMWHMLGSPHLAVPAYEKVLKLSAQVQEDGKTDVWEDREVEDFAKEAALALQNLFVAAGNQDAARAITEEWLVL